MDGKEQSPGTLIGDPVADGHVHRLLLEYARVVGAPIRKVGTSLLELHLPEAERRHFNNRSDGFTRDGRLRVSTDPAARADDIDVELAVSGSAFLEQLVSAIRERGHRLTFGLLPPSGSVDAAHADLSVPADACSVSPAAVLLTVHPIGRLLVRVLVRAGAAAEELLVESGIFDLAGGGPVQPEVAAQCEAAIKGSREPAPMPRDAVVRERRPLAGLIPSMLSELEARLAPEFDRRRADSQRSLVVELGRIDTYYRSLLDGASGPGTEIPTTESRSAVESEHARRRKEEIRRHELSATLQPVQLIEWGLLVQDAEWTLTSRTGHQGTVTATRPLAGAGTWALRCPTCGEVPPAVRVCSQDHVCCSGCSKRCVLCGETTCREHAPASCHVDLAPFCAAHARACLVCRRTTCLQHSHECSAGGHQACSSCLLKCAVCQRRTCTAHATLSPPTAPRGSRPLCRSCTVLCEGGKNEPVGRDEVARCASCDRHVCGAHQAVCDVDRRVHCSSHLRRADRSRRLVCARHQSACVYEPAAIFASDDILECVTCGARACAEHVAPCAHDGAGHCLHHLAPLADQPGRFACERHRGHCHLDQQSYSLGAVAPCPVCDRVTCRSHFAPCSYCARSVCAAELDGTSRRCTTCRRLSAPHAPLEQLLTAATIANGGAPTGAKTWRSARDAGSVVVDVDLGWSRHLVFTVEHGQNTPYTVITHSLLGSRRTH